MTLEPDDPRITAYALGELDPAEREAVEQLLQKNEAARRTVAEIRATAEELALEYQREESITLDPARREHLLQTIAKNVAPASGAAPQHKQSAAGAAPDRLQKKILYYRSFSLIAAGALLAITIGFAVRHFQPAPRLEDASSTARLDESAGKAAEKSVESLDGAPGFVNKTEQKMDELKNSGLRQRKSGSGGANDNKENDNKKDKNLDLNNTGAVAAQDELEQASEEITKKAGAERRIVTPGQFRGNPGGAPLPSPSTSSAGGSNAPATEHKDVKERVAGNPSQSGGPGSQVIRGGDAGETQLPLEAAKPANNINIPGAPVRGEEKSSAGADQQTKYKQQVRPELLKDSDDATKKSGDERELLQTGEGEWKAEDRKPVRDKAGAAKPGSPIIKKNPSDGETGSGEPVKRELDKKEPGNKEKNLSDDAKMLNSLRGGAANDESLQKEDSSRATGDSNEKDPSAGLREGTPEIRSQTAGGVFALHDASRAASSNIALETQTLSWPAIRRAVQNSQLPRPDTIRVDEMLTYFGELDALESSASQGPVSVQAEIANCPWNIQNRLLKITLQANAAPAPARATSLVVYSAIAAGDSAASRLALARQYLKSWMQQFSAADRIAIINNNSRPELALEATPADNRERVQNGVDALRENDAASQLPGLSAAGALARENFIQNGDNRILIITDDLPQAEWDRLIPAVQEIVRSGITVSVLQVNGDEPATQHDLAPSGFAGRGPSVDSLRRVVEAGKGYYNSIQNIQDLQRLLNRRAGELAPVVARNVEFICNMNPDATGAWRQIGGAHESDARPIAKSGPGGAPATPETDAGPGATPAAGGGGGGPRSPGGISYRSASPQDRVLRSGQSIIALYELEPRKAQRADVTDISSLAASASAQAPEYCKISIRYKLADRDIQYSVGVSDSGRSVASMPDHYQFSAAVAAFGLALAQAPHAPGATFDLALNLASPTLGTDPLGERREFVEIVKRARELTGPGRLYARPGADSRPASKPAGGIK